MVFEDRHEAIILRDTYQKVQKRLKSTHQRAPKEINGPKSIFCDILRCADCGSKLWYHTNTQNRDIHYFSCSNYVKDYRGTCLTRHYIRADAVEAVVEMELRRLAEYLVADENRFAEILARRSIKQVESEKKTVQSELRKSEMRIEIIPKLLKTLYEDKLSGKTSEDNYCVLSQEYSDEREQLQKKILKLRRKLTEMGEKESEREEFIRAIRNFMEMRTLTKQVLNELIDHIDVYETQGTGKNKTQRLVIPPDYFSAKLAPCAFFSLPIRYRHKGQSSAGHFLTSVLLPQQQSKHFSRIAFPRVIRSSMRYITSLSFAIFFLRRASKSFTPDKSSSPFTPPSTSASIAVAIFGSLFAVEDVSVFGVVVVIMFGVVVGYRSMSVDAIRHHSLVSTPSFLHHSSKVAGVMPLCLTLLQ